MKTDNKAALAVRKQFRVTERLWRVHLMRLPEAERRKMLVLPPSISRSVKDKLAHVWTYRCRYQNPPRPTCVVDVGRKYASVMIELKRCGTMPDWAVQKLHAMACTLARYKAFYLAGDGITVCVPAEDAEAFACSALDFCLEHAVPEPEPQWWDWAADDERFEDDDFGERIES